jgi:trypsin
MTHPQTDRPFLTRALAQSIVAVAIVCALCAAGCSSKKGGDSTTALPSSPSSVATATPSAATSDSTTGSPGTPTNASDACAAVTGAGFLGNSIQGIINGGVCSASASPVVLVNLWNSTGRNDGFCSGTVISAHAVLTAAHCLLGTASVSLELGGQEVRAASFTAIPSYRDSDSNTPDVGVVIMQDALPRIPIPLLLSNEAKAGDAAIIAGYGDDENGSSGSLRAGPITISSVNGRFLVAQYKGVGSNTCWGDSGGPLLLPGSGGYAIAGVTSGGSDDCTRGFSDFARITNAEISAFILAQAPDAARR